MKKAGKQKVSYVRLFTFKGNAKKQERELQRLIRRYRKQMMQDINDIIYGVKKKYES